MKGNNTITIGADPEVFVQDGVTIVPAIGLVGGTKEAPHPVGCGAIQEDNVMAEFNIDPATSSEEFITNITTVMKHLGDKIRPLRVAVMPSHEFDQATLVRSGRQAMMFGCDPDFNAYSGEQNMPPSPRTVLRTCGGHVHVGYEGVDPERNREIVQAMDLLLGVPSVILDSDTRRRSMYGKAGAYRNKDYGVEYRSLSNFWLGSTTLMDWVFKRSVAAAQAELRPDADRIQHVINTSDVSGARRLIAEYGLEMP